MKQEQDRGVRCSAWLGIPASRSMLQCLLLLCLQPLNELVNLVGTDADSLLTSAAVWRGNANLSVFLIDVNLQC